VGVTKEPVARKTLRKRRAAIGKKAGWEGSRWGTNGDLTGERGVGFAGGFPSFPGSIFGVGTIDPTAITRDKNKWGKLFTVGLGGG